MKTAAEKLQHMVDMKWSISLASDNGMTVLHWSCPTSQGSSFAGSWEQAVSSVYAEYLRRLEAVGK